MRLCAFGLKFCQYARVYAKTGFSIGLTTEHLTKTKKMTEKK